MIESKHDGAVKYVYSKAGSGSHRIVKSVDHIIYLSDTDM
jgi:hypothetical protein